MYTHALIS